VIFHCKKRRIFTQYWTRNKADTHGSLLPYLYIIDNWYSFSDISNADTATLSTSEETAGDSTYSTNQPPNVTEVTDTTHTHTVLSSMSTDITNIHTSTSSLYTSKSETVDTSTSSYHTSTAKTVDTSTNDVTKPTPPEDDDSSFGLSFGIGVPVGIFITVLSMVLVVIYRRRYPYETIKRRSSSSSALNY
jgi:hypothetical protein